MSQRGNTADGRIGWEQYTERRVEEVRLTLSLSVSVCMYTRVIPMSKLMVALFDSECLNCCHIMGTVSTLSNDIKITLIQR